MTKYYNNVSLDTLIGATSALLKFCEDHNHASAQIDSLRTCLGFLNAGDFKQAHATFEKIPFGGYGTFNDWFPPVVFNHETEEYCRAVFDALTERWCRLMKNASGCT